MKRIKDARVRCAFVLLCLLGSFAFLYVLVLCIIGSTGSEGKCHSRNKHDAKQKR